MTTSAPQATAQLAALEDARARTLELIAGLSDTTLTRVVTPLLSPLVWDLGHIGNFEQRWLLHDETSLDGVYNPFENPRAVRGELDLLAPSQCLEYMAAVRDRVRESFAALDPFFVELVIQHEMQHNETMLQLLRMLDDYVPPWRIESSPGGRGEAVSVDDAGYWAELPAGEYEIGTRSLGPGAFVYDNEMGVHTVDLPGAQIARRPVTKGEWCAWIDAGGYADDAAWSTAGRAWRDAEQATAPLSWRPGDDGGYVERQGGLELAIELDAPVVHVSWFEADAFARAHDARLPSEFEWEAAATGAAPEQSRCLDSCGDDTAVADIGVLDQRSFGTVSTGANCTTSACGCEHMLGQVWEWTAGEFDGYPGFEPFAYREYSAPFFGTGYRVLRGGSWATRARTVTARFRNWDHPQRRQIFSGLRLARSA